MKKELKDLVEAVRVDRQPMQMRGTVDADNPGGQLTATLPDGTRVHRHDHMNKVLRSAEWILKHGDASDMLLGQLIGLAENMNYLKGKTGEAGQVELENAINEMARRAKQIRSGEADADRKAYAIDLMLEDAVNKRDTTDKG